MSVEGQELNVLIRADHQLLADSFALLDTADQSELVGLMDSFGRGLMSHERAEEQVIYPALRRVAPDVAAVAQDCRSQEGEAERALMRLDRYRDEPVVLRACLLQLRRDFLLHAWQEESVLLPELLRQAKPKQLAELATDYQRLAAPLRQTAAARVVSQNVSGLGPLHEARRSA